MAPQLLLMTNRKWHMRFRLVPKSSTLDGLELLQFKFSWNFALVHILEGKDG